MGERYLRFWKSKLGEKLFRLAGFKLKRIGLEADRLFEALPKETRESLGTLPETVQALEQDAQAMRQQVAEMDGILAEIGDDDPSRPSAARACERRSHEGRGTGETARSGRGARDHSPWSALHAGRHGNR